MPHTWPNIIEGIQAADNRDGTNLPGGAAEEGGEPRVRSGGRGGVSTDARQETSQSGPGTPPPPPLGRTKLIGYL